MATGGMATGGMASGGGSGGGTGGTPGEACSTPGFACEDNVAVYCGVDGFVQSKEDCGTDLCVSGVCKPIICTPDEYGCAAEGELLRRCSPDGTAWYNWETCDGYKYCKVGESTCQADTCSANKPTCTAEGHVSMCSANGSGPIDEGVECPAGQTCDGLTVTCMDSVCTPLARSCPNGPGGQLVTCNQSGTSESSTNCGSNKFCDDSLTVPGCSYDVCWTTMPACEGETLATCNSSGSGYINPTTDCAQSGMVCTFAGCAASDVATTDQYNTFYDGTPRLFLTRMFITTTRKLTQIEHYGSVNNTPKFTWLVYEGADDAYGEMSQVFTMQNTQGGTSKFFSSGAIDVTLEAGKYYMVGVYVHSGSTFGYGGGTVDFMSFGRIMGGTQYASGGVPTTASGDWVNPGVPIYQRFTTALAN